MRKHKWMENIPLKIVSLVIGFLVWLLVVNIDNPTENRTFVVTGDRISLMNTQYVDSYNKMCLLDDERDPVRVTITGERKLLRRMTTSAIRLTADLQQAVSLDTSPVMVPITAVCDNVNPSNIKVNPQYMAIRLEDKLSQEYVVTASYGESRPGKGYEVGTQTVSPEKVKITGPKSLVSKIDKVTANVNVSGKTKDVSEDVTLVVTDRNQDTLSDAYLTIDNNGRATVTTKFWRVISGVRFSVSTLGEPAEGYHVERVTTVPDTVSVAGNEEAISALRNAEPRMVISGPVIDISGVSDDEEVKANMVNYMPENLRLSSGTSEDIYITFVILPENSHLYSLAGNEVDFQNLGNGLAASIDTDSLAIRVKAADTYKIEDFDVSDLKASIDLQGIGEGSSLLPVHIELPRGYTLLKEVEANVMVTEVSNQ